MCHHCLNLKSNYSLIVRKNASNAIFNMQALSMFGTPRSIGPILPHVLFECRVKLTARVIRSVFHSLKNIKCRIILSEPGSVRVIH